MSRDEDQKYFSDGITEDIITALSRYRWLTVIARNSTFTYKGKAVDVSDVGRELGVRYVLEGSVRKAGNRVRITAQLIEAEGAGHIWAERYDRELDDIFALQDEITETIVLAIEPKLSAAERERARRKATGDLNAWDAYQQGLWHLYRYSAKDHAAARSLFERAVAMDPGFAPAHSALALTYVWAVMFGYTDDRPAAIVAATASAKAALVLDDRDASAHLTLARISLVSGDHDGALEECETALALNPSLAQGHFVRGEALGLLGDYAAALADFELAVKLSPHDPQIWAFEMWAGTMSLMLGDGETANDWARKVLCRSVVQPPAFFLSGLHSCPPRSHRRGQGRHGAAHGGAPGLHHNPPGVRFPQRARGPQGDALRRLAQDRHGRAGRALGDGVQQGFRVLEVRGVEAFGEPAIDRGEQVAGFAGLALGLPEAREGSGGAESPQFCTLRSRNSDRLLESIGGRGVVVWVHRQ